MSKKDEVYLNIKYEKNIYKFLKLVQEDDGSFYLVFLYDKKPKNFIKYGLKFNEKDGLSCEKKAVNERESTKFELKRISYHTTGRVNYHGMTHKSTYFEPLVNIQNINTFFMISIPQITQLQLVEEQNKINGNIIDLSRIKNERLNIYFSIFPCEFDGLGSIKNLITSITYDKFYSFLVTLEIDRLSINLERRIEKNAFLYGASELGLYESQVLGKNEAYIKFQQKLYSTKELILFAPNNAGIFRIVFCVEMRVPPRVNIEFFNDNYQIEIISADTVKLRFKVFDAKSNSYLKDAENVKIKSISLDSEIY
ncbi:hypothetical protein FC789_12770 [Clostridium botulinum]|uniref:hypothetical protein n=1 Tax=Clostridium sp. CH2 TaxID=2949990 RepID=UPI0013F0C8FE|nr:hypothetical protein [Clostridium sp. CH2]NFG42046.1 hypothetical protein [Clostridium botulinum]